MAGAATAEPMPRWSRVAAALTLVYVVAVLADRWQLLDDRFAFTERRAGLDGWVPRALLAVLVVAGIAHALDGARRLLAGGRASGRLGGRASGWTDGRAASGVGRAAVAFAVPALGVPAALVVLWPRVEGLLP